MILKPYRKYNTVVMSENNYAHTRDYEDLCVDFQRVFLTSIATESVILTNTYYTRKIPIILNRRRSMYRTFMNSNK